jgi:signal transduction histidine kinase
VPDLQIALLAEQQEGEALAATNLTLKIIGGALVIIVLLAILAARFITRGITQPVAELAASATLIAQGNLDQKVKIGRDDEVGKLAKAFNSMSTQLRDQFHQQEERAVQLRSINEVGRHISAILQIDELLKYVVAALQANFKYREVGIFLNDEAAGRFILKSAADGYEIGENAGVSAVINAVIHTSEPMLVNDLQHDPVLKPADNTTKTMAELAVGIQVGDKLIGILDIRSDRALVFNEFDLFTVQALADQLAIAIENIRLYEQARELATTKERSRLARDLHDAVSQTLFSASIIADVLPKLWEKDQEEGRRRLAEIRQLTRGALAEMRTLLFELKPAALADAEFSYLLHQLAESITGRTRINVKVLLEGQCELQPDVKIALYRIVQEALNNVAKHANATQASINVSCQGGVIELIITDNGKGFDITKVRAESLGLGIMRGRAKEIGAEISVQSNIGSGSQIIVKVK